MVEPAKGFQLTVDLGQIIVAVTIAVVGYLINLTIVNFKSQLSRHEELITGLVGDVQKLIGVHEGMSHTSWPANKERRRATRD